VNEARVGAPEDRESLDLCIYAPIAALDGYL
jgi:hypothetical protein